MAKKRSDREKPRTAEAKPNAGNDAAGLRSWLAKIPKWTKEIVGFLGALVAASTVIYLLLPPSLNMSLQCRSGDVKLIVRNRRGTVTIDRLELESVSPGRFGDNERHPLQPLSNPLAGRETIERWATQTYEWPGEWDPSIELSPTACKMDATVILASHRKEFTAPCTCER